MSDTPKFPASPRMITLLVATGLVVLMQLYAAIPLSEPVAANLDTSTSTATLALSTCFSLSYAAAFLLWGPIADHVGRRPVILTGITLLVITSLACAFAPNVVLLGLFRALQGIGAASYAPIALAYLTEATAPKHRAAAVGGMATAFLVAGITGQVVASALADEDTWRWMFGGSGLVFVACGAGVLTLVIEPPRTRETTLAGQFRNLGHLIIHPRIMQLAGALTTRIGVAATARVGFLLAAVGLVGEAVLSASIVGTALASLVFVTGVALAVPSMITLFALTSAPHRGAGMALNGFFLFFGASLGPLTTQFNLGFVPLLLRLAGLLVVAALLVTGFLRLEKKPRLKQLS